MQDNCIATGKTIQDIYCVDKWHMMNQTFISYWIVLVFTPQGGARDCFFGVVILICSNMTWPR